MKLRKQQAHLDSNDIIKGEVDKLGYTHYSVSNAIIIPLHNTQGGQVPSKPPQWFQEWSDQAFKPFVNEMNEFKTEMKEFKTEMNEFKTNQEVFNKNIERKVDAILECPTIKKEIKL